MAHVFGGWYMGVGVVCVDILVLEEFYDFEGGRFTEVIDIGFICQAEHEYFLGFGAGFLAYCVDRFVYDELGHAAVYFACEFDESCFFADLFCFPCEIEGIDGYAVSTESGSGVEGGEAERFGCCGLDDLPDIDIHFIEYGFHFVDERDIDSPVDIFHEFGGFCDFAGAYRNNCFECLGINGCCGGS